MVCNAAKNRSDSVQTHHKSEGGLTVSMLAEYIELAVHLRSNSKFSEDFTTVSSSMSVEQNECFDEPDFWVKSTPV
jgi:hypothetical protein